MRTVRPTHRRLAGRSGLVVLGLLALVPATAPARGSDPPPAPAARLVERGLQEHASQEGWEELEAAYASALADWEARYAAAENIQERRALREAHPAAAFWGRFDALAVRDGRAALWLVENAGLAGFRGRDGRGVKAAAYARAFALEGAVDAAWMGPLLERLARDRSAVGDEDFERYLATVAERTGVDALRAQALFELGDWLAGQADEAAAERGLALLKRAAAIEGAPFAERAAARVYELENLVVGAIAPDFTAPLAAGGTFRLSEQRGKVVVLDFFGFW